MPADDQTLLALAEAKRLLRERLLRHPDDGVRALAELGAEPADDHPAVVKIAAALRAQAIRTDKEGA